MLEGHIAGSRGVPKGTHPVLKEMTLTNTPASSGKAHSKLQVVLRQQWEVLIPPGSDMACGLWPAVFMCDRQPQRRRGDKGKNAEDIQRGLRNISYAPAECPGKPAPAPTSPPTSAISLPHHHFPSGLPKNHGWELSNLSGQRNLPITVFMLTLPHKEESY